jgi:hypothetical protein
MACTGIFTLEQICQVIKQTQCDAEERRRQSEVGEQMYRFQRKNTPAGRIQSGVITFLPPLAFALFYPQGFVMALATPQPNTSHSAIEPPGTRHVACVCSLRLFITSNVL